MTFGRPRVCLSITMSLMFFFLYLSFQIYLRVCMRLFMYQSIDRFHSSSPYFKSALTYLSSTHSDSLYDGRQYNHLHPNTQAQAPADGMRACTKWIIDKIKNCSFAFVNFVTTRHKEAIVYRHQSLPGKLWFAFW